MKDDKEQSFADLFKVSGQLSTIRDSIINSIECMDRR